MDNSQLLEKLRECRDGLDEAIEELEMEEYRNRRSARVKNPVDDMMNAAETNIVNSLLKKHRARQNSYFARIPKYNYLNHV